jgi:tape measure domain-containing protein
MATISSTLALNDSMTPVLQSIATALAGINSAFDQIGTPNLDADGINAANRALQQTEDIQDEVTQSMRESSGAAGDLWGKIKGFIAAYAGWEVIKQTVAWSDEITNIKARLDAANDGTQTTEQYMNSIYAAAQRSHAPFQQMADLVGKLRSNAAEAFQSNGEAVLFAEQLNKQFAIAGASQQGASDATFQLIQALGSGALRGEELNSILDQAPNIVRTIADHMNVPIGQIRNLASEGKITADVVKNAILGASEKTNAAFNKVPLTFGAAWTMAKNTFQMNMLGLQKVISNAFNTGQFQEIMNVLTDVVSTFAAVAIPIVQGVVNLIGFMYDNWSLIAPVIFTVIGAMAAYKAVILGQLAIEAISRGLKMAGVVAQFAWAAATGTAASATAAQTAAQMGLNAAMLASPVTWIIAGIAAVIGLLYLAVAVINKVTGANYSATGIIAATIWGLWAYVKNIIAVAWNNMLSLAEFFMNVFTNPVYSIKKLIYSLLETFSGLYLGILQGLDPVITGLAKGFLWAVNKGIKALNVLSSALDKIGLGFGQVGELSMDGSVAEAGQAAVKGMLSAVNPGAAPEGYKSLDHLKMDFANPAEYAASGYEAGAKFSDDPLGAIKGALGLANDPAIQSLIAGQQQGNKTQEQIAKNTGSKEEDYTYLKDIMAGRAVDRLSGTEIKIDMTNNNNVNSALDLDGIVNALTQKLTGAMDSAAEGVHA